jgi:gluconate 2-dehydrogenase gamma chain
MTDISRRAIIKATGAVGATDHAAAQEQDRHNRPSHASSFAASADAQTTYIFFNSDEAAFIEAAVARLIPKDDQWGGALEADVPNYIDKQLAGAWGAGERL